jgi:predicted  nucleic acid-binding Zn-ribbon protein
MDQQEYEKFIEFLKRYGAQQEDLNDIFEKTIKSVPKFKKEIDQLAKEVAKGSKSFKDQKAKIKELEDAIEDLSEATDENTKVANQAKIEALLKMRADLQARAAVQGFGEAARNTAKTVLTNTAIGIAKFTRGLQDGASGTELASGLMEMSIDRNTAYAKGFGQTLQAAAPVVSAFGAYGRAAGLAMSVLGTVTETVADSMSKMAKFGVEILAKEVEKTYKAFNEMSASGALFADGMTGMRNAAGDAGLTVEQFSGVIKANGETIASAGFGMTEGAKKIGGALKSGGDVMKKHLLNLGVGFEEQAELVAQTMKDMRGSSMGPLRATNAQIAEQTEKYAENLKIIASITGEDAKKKAEQVRQEASKLAFQQKIAAKSPEEQAKINRAMENMTDLQRKNFMDMVVFGKVINTDGAIAQATSAGLRDSVQQSYADYQAGILDDDRQRANMSRNQAQMQQDYLKQSALGLAGYAEVGGHAQSVAELIGKDLQQIRQWTPEAIKASEEAAKKQKDTTDKLTKNVTDAEVAAQDLKIALQRDLTKAIAHFAEVSKEMLKGVQDMLDTLGLGKGHDLWDDVKHIAGKTALNTFEGIGGGVVTGTIVPGLGNVTGAVVGGVGGAIYGLGTSIYDTVTGKYADGGIAQGPLSGYRAELHGTEAVVPLPDGNKIPVEINHNKENSGGVLGDKSIKDMLDELKRGHAMTNANLTDLIRVMKDNNSLTSGILQNSY